MIINDLTFVSYIAFFDIYRPSGRKYLSQHAETVSAASDDEAWTRAHARAKELSERDKEGDRYWVVCIKKSETHHRVTTVNPATCPFCGHNIFGDNHTCGTECLCIYCGVGDDPYYSTFEGACCDLPERVK